MAKRQRDRFDVRKAPRPPRAAGAPPGAAALEPDPKLAQADIGVTGMRVSAGGFHGSTIYDDTRRIGYAERLSLYREMSRQPVFATAMVVWRALLGGITYRVRAGRDSSDPTLRMRAAFADEALADMSEPLALTSVDTWKCLQDGLSAHEVIFKARRGGAPGTYVDAAGFTRELPSSRADDGLIGIDRLEPRAPGTFERWLLNANNGVEGVVQRDPSTSREVVLPAWKLLLVRHGTRANVLGESLFDGSVDTYRLWKRMLEALAIGHTRRLAGTPYARVPEAWMSVARPGESADAALARKAGETLKQVLQSWAADPHGYIMTPAMYDEAGNKLLEVGLIGYDGDPGVDSVAAINHLELRMASSLLVAMMFLGQAQAGTQALAREQSQVLRGVLNGLAAQYAAAVSAQLFQPLMRLNGWPASEAPELYAEPLTEVPTLEELSRSIAAMANAGFLSPPDKVLLDAWRARAAVGPMADEDQLEADESAEDTEDAEPSGVDPETDDAVGPAGAGADDE